MASTRVVVTLAVAAALAVAGCSSRSTRKDASSGGTSGNTGHHSGGSAAGGGKTASGGTGGATAGSSATGGSPQGGTAGTSGTSGGAAPTAGSSPAGGTPSTGGGAGTAGTGGDSAGTSGDAGEGGASGCAEPAPGGCPARRCAEGQECQLLSGQCVPSRCECVRDEWVCTEDCGGGVCVDAVSCGQDPSGCLTDDDCTGEEVCTPPADDACIPTRCACPITGIWQCENDCNGGTCRLPTCPAACEPQIEGFCGEGQVTWVCTGTGVPYQEFIDAGCTDPATQVPRLCCPATYKSECF
jgi:hypothetical protein